MAKRYIKTFLIFFMYIFIFNSPSFAIQLSLDDSGNHSTVIDSNRVSSKAFSNSYGSIVFRDCYTSSQKTYWEDKLFYKDYFIVREGSKGLSIIKLNGDKSKLITNLKGIPDNLAFAGMEVDGHYLFLYPVFGLNKNIRIFDLSKLPSEITELSSWNGSLIKKWNNNHTEGDMKLKGDFLFLAGGNGISIFDIKDISSVYLRKVVELFEITPQTLWYEMYPIEIAKGKLYAVVKHVFYTYNEITSSRQGLYAWQINDDATLSFAGMINLHAYNGIIGNIKIKNDYVYLTYSPNSDWENMKLSIFHISNRGMNKIAEIPEVSQFYIANGYGFGFYFLFDWDSEIVEWKSTVLKVFDISNPSKPKKIGMTEKIYDDSNGYEPFITNGKYFAGYYGTIYKIEAIVPSVTAKAKKKRVILRWKSEMEDGIKKYYIRRKLNTEKSSSEAIFDGKRKWRLRPKNKSSKKSRYKIIDKKVNRKTSYIYSLYARDTSGKNTLIKALAVTIP